MNEDSRWRFALGQRIGKAYAANPKVRVVMVAGSTGRGTADRYSDLEIDVYYAEPPTAAERRAAVERSGGRLIALAEDADEWEEQIDFRGFHAATSTFLVGTMELYLHTVLDEYSTDASAQIRLHSVLHAQTLAGEDQVARWRRRALQYPRALTYAMLTANLPFAGFGYAEEMLAARDDRLRLYDIFCAVERQVLGALLGLNRLYLPNPGFKGLDELVAEMRLAPPDLAARLKDAFHAPPPAGVRQLHQVIAEVFDLVAAELPEFDIAPYQARMATRRPVWDSPPSRGGGEKLP